MKKGGDVNVTMDTENLQTILLPVLSAILNVLNVPLLETLLVQNVLLLTPMSIMEVVSATTDTESLQTIQ